MAALRAPFPASAVGKLPKVTCSQCTQNKGQCDNHRKSKCAECGNYITPAHLHLDFIGHAATTQRLLEVDPGWTWEPVAFDAAGLPARDQLGGLWIRLTVCGVTRYGYGDAAGKPGPNAVKEAIGDAIRNAAMRFGVALDLWAKEDISSTLTDTGAGDGGEAAPAPAKRRSAAGNRDQGDPASSNDGLFRALQAALSQWQKAQDASRADVLLLVSSVVDREVASTKDLTVGEARKCLDALSQQAVSS
jgi:hypothetical protein